MAGWLLLASWKLEAVKQYRVRVGSGVGLDN